MKKEFVLEWFEKNSTMTREELENNLEINYLEEGLIDSFGFLELISACEEQLGISFNDDDFANDEMFTLSGLIATLEEY